MAKKKKSRSRGLPLFDWATSRNRKRSLKALLLAIAAASVVAGFGYGLYALRLGVADMSAYRLHASDLSLISGPRWMTPEIIASLDVSADLPEEFSLLDEGIVEKIALAYKRKVWVKEVLRIEKRYPDPRRWQSPIEVHLQFRRPIAFIEVAGRFYLVDGEGIRLPGVYDRPRLGAEEMFVITGVRTRPPGPGRKWDAKSLRCGLTVASALRSRRVSFRLARIDVGNIGGRRDARLSEIAIYTGQDTRIDWGKPPSRRADILDKPLADKIAYLDYVYRQFGGRIDDDLVYVDIPNETVRRRPSPYVY